MIYIICAESNSRLEYITGILFGSILKTAYTICPAKPSLLGRTDACISYGTASPDSLSIPDEGLIYEKGIITKTPSVSQNEGTDIIRFSAKDFSGFDIPFDILSAAFFVVTEYQNYLPSEKDEHGRYNETAGFVFVNKLHRTPLLHVYAHYIWQKLIRYNPEIVREGSEFSYLITFDIDSPYLYLYKPLHISIGGILKDTFSGALKALTQRLRALMSRKDPYDVFDYIKLKVKAEKLLFFFLLDRNSPHDERHTYRNAHYRQLIRSISKEIAVGIHPSYTSFTDGERIKQETARLSEITGHTVLNARMHYLKYRLPETFRYLIEAGIRDDFTLCPVRHTGFKTGMCIAYPFYDLLKDEQTSLILHPVMIMDRSLQKYNNITAGQALKEITQMIDVCRQYSGQFIILLHNNTLSETAEWKGWRKTFEKMLEYLG